MYTGNLTEPQIFMLGLLLLCACLAIVLIFMLWQLRRESVVSLTPRIVTMPLLIIVVGIVASLGTSYHLRNLYLENAQQDFIKSATKFTGFVQSRLMVHIHSLTSVKSFFDASDKVDRKEFSVFSKHIVSGFPEISALYYIATVKRDAVDVHQEEARKEIPEYTIKSFKGGIASESPEIYSIFYAEPEELARPHLGYDLTTHKALSSSIGQALDSNEPIMSSLVDDFSFTGNGDGRRKLVIFTKVAAGLSDGSTANLLALFIDTTTLKEQASAISEGGGYEVIISDELPQNAVIGQLRNDVYWDAIPFKGKSLFVKFKVTDPSTFRSPQENFFIVLIGGILMTFLLSYTWWQSSRIGRIVSHLKESEERYALGVNGAGTTLWDWDLANQKIVWGGNARELFGAHEDEDLPDTNLSVRALMPEEDRAHIDERIAASLEKNQNGMFSVEFRMSKLGGEPIWVLSRGKIVAEKNGIPIRMSGTLVDITERKRAEETALLYQKRMEAVLDQMVDGLITIDEAGLIQSYNKACENMFGYTADEIMGKNVKILMPTSYAEHHDGYLHNYMTTGKAKIIGIGREVEGQSKDGTIFPIDLSVAEIKLPGTDYPRVFSGLVRDITQRKEYERTLLRSNKELEQFAYVASHDLKAPLRSIDNLAKWVVEDTQDILPDDAKEKLDMLRGRISRLENLLDDILSYSRAGRIVDDPVTIDLATMVTSLAQMYLPEKFKLRIEGELPTLVSPRTPLEQIFGNIFSNAVKHHDKGEGEITVSVKDTGNFYEFSVRDDGPGILPEFHERAFQMFQTLQPRDKVDGSGLGMSIIKKLVEWQNGRVWIESDGIRGTDILFCWPKNFKK